VIGLAHGLVDVKVAAVDDVWSGLKFVRRVKRRSERPRHDRRGRFALPVTGSRNAQGKVHACLVSSLLRAAASLNGIGKFKPAPRSRPAPPDARRRGVDVQLPEHPCIEPTRAALPQQRIALLVQNGVEHRVRNDTCGRRQSPSLVRMKFASASAVDSYLSPSSPRPVTAATLCS